MLKLPKEIRIAYCDNWHTLTTEEKQERLREWLSETYGYCHNGFAYKEYDWYIHIIDIDWDVTE